jgi:GDP/UDP-N,N'-diacetylbacillosamine 2-epimerase (hydrolysing)
MKVKKIVAVTGARSDYDLLYSIYQKLNQDENFDFKILITGAHLSDTFGYTAKQVENDNFTICGRVFNLIDSNQKIGRVISIGNQIGSVSNILFHEKPDIVLIAGDREESISVTLVCAYMNIAVAHFFGGDIVKDGNIDNSVRYAASKFAHLHFPTLPQHRETLLKLGEDDWRIFVVGNPAIDRIISTPFKSQEEVIKYFYAVNTLKIEKYCVLIQHPIITQVNLQKQHIRETLEAILESDLHCFINYPNSDSGFLPIIEAYEEYASKYPSKFTIFKNLDRIYYVNLLRHCALLIGNSSSGIVEVATLGIPVINVGERQRGRIHAQNIIFTQNARREISDAIDRCLTDQLFLEKVKKCDNPYGTGNSADKIVEILKNIEINDRLIHKDITY